VRAARRHDRKVTDVTRGEPDGATEAIYADMGMRRTTGIDDRHLPLLTSTNFVVVSTLGASGAPHGAPMWVDTDGTDLLLNTETYRVWAKNLARDPRVSCVIMDNGNPYQYLLVRGRARAPESEGAQEHADKLAKRYLGIDKYPHAGRPRKIIRVVPEHVAFIHPPTGGVLEQTLDD
jgi:PPOX class probable F420-dependent enzyme